MRRRDRPDIATVHHPASVGGSQAIADLIPDLAGAPAVVTDEQMALRAEGDRNFVDAVARSVAAIVMTRLSHPRSHRGPWRR